MYVLVQRSQRFCLVNSIPLLRWSFADFSVTCALLACPVIDRCEAWVREGLLLLRFGNRRAVLIERGRGFVLVELAEFALKHLGQSVGLLGCCRRAVRCGPSDALRHRTHPQDRRLSR